MIIKPRDRSTYCKPIEETTLKAQKKGHRTVVVLLKAVSDALRNSTENELMKKLDPNFDPSLLENEGTD